MRKQSASHNKHGKTLHTSGTKKQGSNNYGQTESKVSHKVQMKQGKAS